MFHAVPPIHQMLTASCKCWHGDPETEPLMDCNGSTQEHAWYRHALVEHRTTRWVATSTTYAWGFGTKVKHAELIYKWVTYEKNKGHQYYKWQPDVSFARNIWCNGNKYTKLNSHDVPRVKLDKKDSGHIGNNGLGHACLVALAIRCSLSYDNGKNNSNYYPDIDSLITLITKKTQPYHLSLT